jgi:ArsR family transcriptional regulator
MAHSKKNEFTEKEMRLAEYARALSHPARIVILSVLAEKNRCICGEIVEVLPLAQSTVSQHLKELKNAGLITGEVEGPRSCYCINKTALKELAGIFSDFFGGLNNKTSGGDCCR